ncbi:MAG: rRNA pseudouridine synthase [Hyphomicrobium sp.]|nr:rRNA pseudouridine synthase [Hyphomicrobium sp.]
MSDKVQTLRLDRLLANMGYGSRKDIQALVKFGRISLDGAPVTDADMHVRVSPDLSSRMKIAGHPLDPPPGVVLVMHKPLGVTCSHKEAGPLVYELLPLRWRARKPAISTVGRLDKETSGLLLMTDDGALLHRIIAPKSNITKRYRATLARPLRGDEAAALASGKLMLEGESKPLLPVSMDCIAAPSLSEPVVQVTLSEGRYHQVRRMFAALGNHVTALHRDSVGGLLLPAYLDAGKYRVLTSDQTASIFAG